jgi:hypothetical protein
MVWFILIEIGVWVMSTLLARSCDRIAAIGSTLVVGSSTNAGIIVLHVYHTFLNFFFSIDENCTSSVPWKVSLLTFTKYVHFLFLQNTFDCSSYKKYK